jgi:arylsulfatase A-like enzyme/Flp pilus assembly protein TadD
MSSSKRSSKTVARPLVAGLVIVAAIAAGGLWLGRGFSRRAIQSGACGGCNVLLITIDTLRTDRVGAYGGPGGLTPNLDRLAAEGFRLTRAYSAAPLTLPSHTSILTAVSPPVHGVRANGLFRLGTNLPTLATVLKSAGFRTGAFVGSFILDARFGLNRGFDVYDDRYGEKHAGDPSEGARRRAEEVIKPAVAWIVNGDFASNSSLSGTPPGATAAPARPPTAETFPVETSSARASGTGAAATRPFFAWIHLYDPHDPYHAPEPYASRYKPYDAAVAYADAMVGRLLNDLQVAGLLDRTLVVVAADHGESLGEHGERTHGVFAYDVTLRVPWIVWAGQHLTSVRGSSFDPPVRLIDLAPTTLDLIGVPVPAEFEGRTVLPVISGRSRAPAFAYFEAMDANLTRNWAPLTGVISGEFKLIDLPIPELYDLTADPAETTNLFVRDSERARTLGALLRDTMTAFAPRSAGGQRAALGAESRQRLQALGYIGSAADPAHRVYTDADDPKTMIGPSNDLNRAIDDFNSGSHREAITAVESIIRNHPGFATAYGQLASMRRSTGDLRGAIAILEDVVARGIVDHRVVVELGGYLEEAGQHEKAIEVLSAVIASHPDDVDAYNSLGAVYSATGRHDLARAACRQALQRDPTSAIAFENLGVDEIRSGDLAAAVGDLSRALDLDPQLAGAHNAIAAVYMQMHRSDEAIAHWRTAVQLNPGLFDAVYNLGTTLYAAGQRDEARPLLELFLKDAPAAKYGPDIARIRKVLEGR